jgi:hypothetical protein
MEFGCIGAQYFILISPKKPDYCPTHKRLDLWNYPVVNAG